jgi:4-diphosphocytidyl-2-C-methyl-D-erythritol kinase
MLSIRVAAFAKVNLRLEVLGRRPDGYHELRTIFQSLALHDTLILRRTRAPGIELRVAGDSVLAAEETRKNLVWRAIDAVQREFVKRGEKRGRVEGGIRAELQKRIPSGRGLGGGSSDAAAAIVGVLRLTGRSLPLPRLLEIAASLGADVPFFLFGGRALGVGRGDEIYPLPDLPRRTVLVVSPHNISVSTREAYSRLGAALARKGDPRLTKQDTVSTLWCFCALCWSPRGAGLSNDFEPAVFPWYPRLGRIRRELLKYGAAEASLAGSGSAVFAIFRNPAQARRAAQKFPEDRVFLSTTQSRRAYTRALWGAAGEFTGGY